MGVILMKSFIKHGHDLFTFRLSLIGYVIIAISCNGLYQSMFFGNSVPTIFWILTAFVGGLILLKKDIYCYKNKKQIPIDYDLYFIIPSAIVMFLPIRNDIALITMLLYVFIFLIAYITGYFQRI